MDAFARIPLALACLLILYPIPHLASADVDVYTARELSAAGAIFPLQHFLELARAIHPGRVIDAKLKHEGSHDNYVYEVEILDSRGEIWEVEFDAVTGRLLEHERESD